MRLTFDKSVPLAEQRLRVALSQGVRKKGKKHGTGKRNKAISAAKKARAKAKVAANDAARKKRLAAARAYWSGEAEELRAW